MKDLEILRVLKSDLKLIILKAKSWSKWYKKEICHNTWNIHFPLYPVKNLKWSGFLHWLLCGLWYQVTNAVCSFTNTILIQCFLTLDTWTKTCTALYSFLEVHCCYSSVLSHFFQDCLLCSSQDVCLRDRREQSRSLAMLL